MSNGKVKQIDGEKGARRIRRMPLGPDSERIQVIVSRKEYAEFLKLCDSRRQSESSFAAMIITEWMKKNK